MRPRTPGPPTISLNVISAPSQRLYALHALAFLQALKLYEVVSWQMTNTLDDTNIDLAVKWILVDAIFILLLAYLRIPWLTFSKPAIIAQFALVIILNLLLCAKISPSFQFFVPSVIRALYDYQTALTEKRIVIQDILLNETHIQGRHVIHIRPHSSAVINPDGRCFCVGFQKPTAFIPIMFNNTDVFQMDFTRINSNGKIENGTFQATSLIQVENNVVDDNDSRERKITKLFPVDSPGLYKLVRVRDRSGRYARVVQGTSALVVPCPIATLEGTKSQSWRDPVDEHTCVGQHLIQTKFVATGFPPLEIEYSRFINGIIERKHIPNIVPESHIKLPLVKSDNSKVSHYHWNEADSFETSTKVEIPLNFTFDEPMEYTLHLDSVTDACGNKLDLEALRNAGRQRPDGIVDERLLKVHMHPSVRFSSCDPINPVKLIDGKTVNLRMKIEKAGTIKEDELQLNVTQQNWDLDGEQIATLDPVTLDNGMIEIEKEILHKLKPQGNIYDLTVSEPGIYRIRGIKDTFCQGDVKEPSFCYVARVPRPQIDITFEPIRDACAGDVGVKAHMLLNGEPPFTVGYYVKYPITWKQPQNLLSKYHKVTIPKTRYDLDLRPSSSGLHTYTFTDLSDANYEREKIDFSISQSVIPMSDVKFKTRSNAQVRACVEDTVTIELEFSGIGPWNLEYEIMSGNIRKSFTIKDVKEHDYKITLPVFSSGGRHLISLNRLTDAKGCVRQLSEPDLIIDVRKDRPTAAFSYHQNVRNMTIRQGSTANLPLRLNGEGPFSLNYINLDNGQEYETIVHNKNGFLFIKEAGHYRLLSVHDPYCQGTIISGESNFSVYYLPQPQIRISKDAGPRSGKLIQKDAICEGVDDMFEVEFSGEAPYIATYHVNGKHSSRYKVESALSRAQVEVHNDPGLWRYEFTSIADANYPDLSKPESVEIVEQRVWDKPKAFFKKHKVIRNYCVGDAVGASSDLTNESIEIKLEGLAPFNVTLGLYDMETKREETWDLNIENHSHVINIPALKLYSVGVYRFSVISVQDSHGCIAKYDSGSTKETSVTLDVAEIANIVPMVASQDHCVGDILEFALAGTAPWSITYIFNGKKTIVTGLNSPRFSRVAHEPGELEMLSVSHQRKRCETAISNLRKIIHEIPSVRVSDVTEDIEEGASAEVIFEFIGTPPFTFTYTRSDSQGTSILETHTITNLNERHYSIFTSEEGAFETIYVKDAFCEFPVGMDHKRMLPNPRSPLMIKERVKDEGVHDEL